MLHRGYKKTQDEILKMLTVAQLPLSIENVKHLSLVSLLKATRPSLIHVTDTLVDGFCMFPLGAPLRGKLSFIVLVTCHFIPSFGKTAEATICSTRSRQMHTRPFSASYGHDEIMADPYEKTSNLFPFSSPNTTVLSVNVIHGSQSSLHRSKA